MNKQLMHTRERARVGMPARAGAGGIALAMLVAASLWVSTAAAQVGYDRADHYAGDRIGIDIWTERGSDWVYGHDEIASISFRAHDDAFVVVYGTDADGAVHLLYPTQDHHRRRVRRDRVYTIDTYDLHAAGVEGVVYVEALACAYPLEPHLPAFFHARGPRYRPHRVGRATGLVVRLGYVVGDPYLAFAELRGAIVPRGCAPSYVGYATLSYSIGTHRYYPRYVCNDCHYGGWYDPYYDSCVVFEIRIDSFWTNRYPYYDRCQPRYYYWKRASVPVRYRHYKTKWSSKDRSSEMIRYFAGKSPRERDHLDARTKPALVRGGRDGDIRGPLVEPGKPGRGGRDGESPVVRGGRDRPEDSRGKPGTVRDGRADPRGRADRDERAKKEIDQKERERTERDRKQKDIEKKEREQKERDEKVAQQKRERKPRDEKVKPNNDRGERKAVDRPRDRDAKDNRRSGKRPKRSR